MNPRPIYKKIQPCYESQPGVLRMGEFHGPVEMEDENGSIRMLVQLMDGTRTVPELHGELAKTYPEILLDEVEAAVEEIDRLGFLYDQAAELATDLSQYQRDRFKGNLNFLSFYSNMDHPPSKYQERLLQAHVTVLGMGAFGCSILFNLAGLGVRNVRIADFDTVSLSNLNRQMLFHEGDIGRSKIEVAQEFMSRFYSDMKIEAIPAQIRSAEDVEQLIDGTDVVVLAADQPMFIIANWVNKACVNKGIPFIGGGLNVNVGQMAFIKPGETGCVDCTSYHRQQRSPSFVPIMERLLEANQVPPNMATAPGLQLVTGMMATEIFKYLTGFAEMEAFGATVRLNLVTYEKTRIPFDRYPDHCPTCGTGEGKEPMFTRVFHNPVFHSREPVER